jgi:hypothetical protein
VARALHARIAGDFAVGIENVGKRALDESGKYPVNENDEEISQSSRATTGTRNFAQCKRRGSFNTVDPASLRAKRSKSI